MIVEIQDLQVGDEILICCQTTFKRLRVRKAPEKDKSGNWKRVSCDIRNDSKGIPGYWASYNFKNPEYNDVFRVRLDWRDMWLIDRKRI